MRIARIFILFALFAALTCYTQHACEIGGSEDSAKAMLQVARILADKEQWDDVLIASVIGIEMHESTYSPFFKLIHKALQHSSMDLEAARQQNERFLAQSPCSASVVHGADVFLTPLTGLLQGSWVRGPSRELRVYDSQLLESFFRLTLKKEAPLVLDIGANSGSFSLLPAGHPGMRVFCWEPIPVVHDVLRRNIQLTGISDRVFPQSWAMSSGPGNATLKVPLGSGAVGQAIGTGYSSLSPMPYAGHWALTENTIHIPVQLDSLDNWADRIGLPHVDFMKLDIEGGEFDALQGARRLIHRDWPDIVMELGDWSRAFGLSGMDASQLLLSWGYTSMQITPTDAFFTKIDHEALLVQHPGKLALGHELLMNYGFAHIDGRQATSMRVECTGHKYSETRVVPRAARSSVLSVKMPTRPGTYELVFSALDSTGSTLVSEQSTVEVIPAPRGAPPVMFPEDVGLRLRYHGEGDDTSFYDLEDDQVLWAGEPDVIVVEVVGLPLPYEACLQLVLDDRLVAARCQNLERTLSLYIPAPQAAENVVMEGRLVDSMGVVHRRIVRHVSIVENVLDETADVAFSAPKQAGFAAAPAPVAAGVDVPRHIRREDAFSNRLAQHALHELDSQGFTVLQDVISPDLVMSLREEILAVAMAEADAADEEALFSQETQRVWKLHEKMNSTWMITHQPVLDGIFHLLGDTLELSSLTANIVYPDAAHSGLHVDFPLNEFGTSRPFPLPSQPSVANTIWMLDDFMEDNGATAVVPGSHLRLHAIPDNRQYHDEVPLLGSAGSVGVINGAVWHGATANTSDRPRVAVLAFFCRPGVPRQLDTPMDKSMRY